MSVDVDPGALDVCKTNLDDYDISNVDLLQMDLTTLDLATDSRWKGCVDTVVMNPPFGTKKQEGMGKKSDFMLLNC